MDNMFNRLKNDHSCSQEAAVDYTERLELLHCLKQQPLKSDLHVFRTWAAVQFGDVQCIFLLHLRFSCAGENLTRGLQHSV
jgi:hypothetical protein